MTAEAVVWTAGCVCQSKARQVTVSQAEPTLDCVGAFPIWMVVVLVTLPVKIKALCLP